MSLNAKTGLTWGAVLLLLQLLLAGVIVPGFASYGEHGRRAAADAVFSGVVLIVFGLAVVGVILSARRRA